MKKLSKIFLFLVLSFILFPSLINASTKETDYVSIYDSCEVSIDSLTLKNVHLDSSNAQENFVLEVQSAENSYNEYKLIIYYYDDNFNLLGDSGNYYITDSTNKITFPQYFYNIDKNKIKYYKLNISSNTKNNSVIDNQNYDYTSGDYYISDYDININVNENNTFDITEKITAYFNVPKHGIYRKIPKKNKITRLDGSKSNNIAKISNVSIDEKYKTYSENGYKVFEIGDDYNTITGSHTYNISYKYNIGRDPLKNSDELYFNLIGTEWDTSINNVTFTITMPKEFDPTKLGFSSGSLGSTDSTNIDYKVNGNTIKGKLLKSLNATEALTVRLTLPEGYFVNASYNVDIYSIFLIVISLIFAVVAYILWHKFGRDDTVIETVEFYPPDGYNSAEIAYLFKGDVTSKEIVSLLIYLADKGYLKIEENSERTTSLSLKEKDFKITKIKEYDGSNEFEKTFFDNLFKARKTINANNQNEEIKNSVTGSELYDHFYLTISKIRKEIIKKLKPKIFELYSDKVKILIGMIIIILILISAPSVYEENSGFYFFRAMASSLIIPIFVLFIILSSVSKENNSNGGIIFGLMFMGMFLVSILFQDDLSFIISRIIAIISIIVLIVFIAIMPKRNKYGNEILGKIKGFKNFLETAEKEQLEALVNQNPEYFYNILPYTYALGVSEIWMKQFETISMQSPKWYVSNNTFTVSDFNNFINSTMQSAQSTMASSSFSSSSDSSGGGSSGGGSGGGGGGSW